MKNNQHNDLNWLQSLLFSQIRESDSMERYLAALKKELKIGRLIRKRGASQSSKLIRWGLTKWIRRIAKDMGLDPKKYEVWGDHDALIAELRTGEMCVAECVARGAILTPWSVYEDNIRKGKCKVRLYDVIDATDFQRLQAQRNWFAKVHGKPYDFIAYDRLIIKSLLIDFSDIEPTNSIKRYLKSIGDSAAGWEWAYWCTEGIAVAYEETPPGIDIFQTLNPTPLTTSQIAGELPRKPEKRTTIREIKIIF